MLSITVVIFFAINMCIVSMAQESDTIEWQPQLTLPEVVIVESASGNDVEFERLKRAIEVVYPYAYMASRLYVAIEDSLAKAKSKRVKRKYLRMLEKVLERHFAKPLKRLTIYQGKVLVLLISRELGMPLYDVIKKYKSGLSARYWQTIGSILGYDLKQMYDPEIHRQIEVLVQAQEINFRNFQRHKYDKLLERFLKQVSIEEIEAQREERKSFWRRLFGSDK